MAHHKWNKYPPVPPMIRVWEAVMVPKHLPSSAVTEMLEFPHRFLQISFFFPLAWVWYSEVLQIRYFSGSLLCVHSLKFKESWRHESPGSIDAWNYCLSISEKYILLLLNTGIWTFLFTGAAKFVSPKNNREMWKECDAECKPFPSQFIRRRGRTFHYPGQYLGAICLWVTAHMQAVDASSSTSSDTNH